MKRIISIISIVAVLILGACDSIEDRDILKNSYAPDDIELAVVQSANGTGNGITLKMNTPGVYGYWDYKLGRRFSNEVSFVCPFVGKVDFTYYVSTPIIKDGDPTKREYVSKTIQVDIKTADQKVDDPYYLLVGEELEGKTWVFDRGNPNWWYMSADPPNAPPAGNPWAVWWNASDCCAPPDQGGKMVFDLNGAANYSYYADANSNTKISGTFGFNTDFSKLTIGGGPNILGAQGTEGVNGCAISKSTYGVFQIVELTADKLVLYVPDASCGSGWTWIFVPAE